MKTFLLRQGRAVLAVLLVSAACEAAAQNPPRELQPLAPEDPTSAFAINKHGEVAGRSGDQPVVWDREGTPIALPLLDDDSVTGEAFAINNRGELAGYVHRSAVLWNRERMPRALQPSEGTTDCMARGVNNFRQVAGHCWSDDDILAGVAVRWNRDGVPTALPVLEGSTGCVAHALNNLGKAAGTCWNPDGTTTAVVWGSGKEAKVKALRRFEEGEDVSSEAFAINNRGQVVGYIDGPGLKTAVVWNPGRRPKALPPFDPGDGGGHDGEARAINDRGEVAGVTILAGIEANATVWDRNGTPIRLTPPIDNVDTYWAFGINNRGQVAGTDTGGDEFAVVWDDWRESRPMRVGSIR